MTPEFRAFLERAAGIRPASSAPGVPATMWNGADVAAVVAEAKRLLAAADRPDFLAVARDVLTDPARNRYGVPEAVGRGAGYDVEPDGFGSGFILRDPEGVEIERAATDRSWPTEREAWEKARQCHEEAHPAPGEFTRATEAGYKVNPNGDGRWQAEDPDGETITPPGAPEGVEAFETERAAWEACDGHRRLGRA